MSEPPVEESTTATANLNRLIALGDEVLNTLKALTSEIETDNVALPAP